MLESSDEMPSVIASGGGSMRLNSEDRLYSSARAKQRNHAQFDIGRFVQRHRQHCPDRALGRQTWLSERLTHVVDRATLDQAQLERRHLAQLDVEPALR